MIVKAIHEKGKFSLQDLIEGLRNAEEFHRIGAVALFIGVVRGETSKGERVKKLEIEAYEEKANSVVSSICTDLKKRKGIIDVQIHHMLGEFDVGEDLVYVLVAGSHRKDVFPVLEEAVERYKKEVPIFKKEYVINYDGRLKAYWVSEQKMR
ncbi:MAG: molybdenum cofactor biosynthesis protein MoaE [Candidatus Bathyarchaeia archaeon]